VRAQPAGGVPDDWHIEVIAARLAAVREGEICRLIISLPPRHLKSLMTSIAFPAWCLGTVPRRRSPPSGMARIARDCRSVIKGAGGCEGAVTRERALRFG
jgi:hypothetical protein